MCRSIRPLFNYSPPVTELEIHEAALQFVRKISGSRQPSAINEKAFNKAVKDIATTSQTLLLALQTKQAPKKREAHDKH